MIKGAPIHSIIYFLVPCSYPLVTMMIKYHKSEQLEWLVIAADCGITRYVSCVAQFYHPILLRHVFEYPIINGIVCSPLV
jgi:hypothetical protein